MADKVKIVPAELARRAHRDALMFLIDLYARDPMEGGEPLPENVMRDLVPWLRKHPARFVWLAYAGTEAIGFTICFLGFSTFNARPLMNIHDISVRSEFRGLGVGKMLMEAVEAKARELKCCKLTLEVREDNEVARGLYRKLGFDRSVVGANRAAMEFWQKPI